MLDLGGVAGKTCFIPSEISRPEGLVIGFDTTADRLARARDMRDMRDTQHDEAKAPGRADVEHRRGPIPYRGETGC